ncbi:Mrp/NBP35 family ATP-binding protein [Rhodovulum strictum]|uniref:Iron-sulfur cluster carrier protein n=1 Tax=Rhodovulum strictum TaxID=58314 RepID=A0A844B6G9_9RHOB|nr:Mrp/NBP35 family ATP-binding protein [Rhodovulum strictum]MRH21976.1 P-loop NTPase [Rhodovulum strictum]
MNAETDTTLLARARAALAPLPLPGGGTLGASDRLAGLSSSAGLVTAAIRVTRDEAPAFAGLRAAAETVLAALPGVARAQAVLTGEAPAPAPGRPAILPGVRHVIAVASGKGGVGKSTTAVNLALGLRAQGLAVGLLDADIHGPSAPTLLGLRGQPRLGPGRRLLPMEAFGLKAMSMGVLVDAETAMIWRGPMVMSAITQMLAEVDWGRLDVLVVDMPPGTGDAQLAIAQGARLSGAVIVSTPQDLALIDARRGIAMFRKLDVPILGLIENMAQFLCPTCGSTHAIFGTGGAEAEAARLGVPFLGPVPLTMELRHASDRGQPVTALDPDGPLGQIYQALARSIAAALVPPTPTTKEEIPG